MAQLLLINDCSYKDCCCLGDIVGVFNNGWVFSTAEITGFDILDLDLECTADELNTYLETLMPEGAEERVQSCKYKFCYIDADAPWDNGMFICNCV